MVIGPDTFCAGLVSFWQETANNAAVSATDAITVFFNFILFFVFTVLKKNITNDVVMSVEPDSLFVGDNATFSIALPLGASGNVNVTFDGVVWLANEPVTGSLSFIRSSLAAAIKERI